MKSIPTYRLAAPLLLGLIGCDSSQILVDHSRATVEETVGRLKAVRLTTPDDEDARIAREELPGYAGVIYDRQSGGVIIQLKDTVQAEARVQAFASRQGGSSRLLGRVARWNKVEFDFNELKTYFDAIESVAFAPFSSLDIDERRNRVVLGVVPGTARSVIRSFLESVGVPERAVIVEQTRLSYRKGGPGGANLDTCDNGECEFTGGGGGDAGESYVMGGGSAAQGPGLQAFQPILVGGLRIEYAQGSSRIVCSIGASARLWIGTYAIEGFLTASHCSADGRGGSLDHTQFTQGYFDGHMETVAQKVVDPSYETFSGCAGGYVCRYSDTQFAYYDSFGRPNSFGYLASPILVNSNDNVARVEIAALNGVPIVQNRGVPFALLTLGAQVHNLGQSTGHTTATVSSTCKDVPFTNGTLLKCQYEGTADNASGPDPVTFGDSGGAVWSTYDGGAMFEGTIVAKGSVNSRRYIFSPWFNIAGEFGRPYMSSICVYAGCTPSH